MAFRTVIISNPAKLSFKENHLMIIGETTKMVHLSEISVLIIESNLVQITARLINELINFKIKLIFCDERHSPSCELVPYASNYHTTKHIMRQVAWDKYRQQELWTHIIANKIRNQARLLNQKSLSNADKLFGYIAELEFNDTTNREGHSAKVYFNTLFGLGFTRESNTNEAKALDYGYTILLSCFNRAIANMGYINQLGVHHKNEFNAFNLACDLIEPFRILVDKIVFENKNRPFDSDYKRVLVDVLNQEIMFNGKRNYVSNAISQYVSLAIYFLETPQKEYVAYEYGV